MNEKEEKQGELPLTEEFKALMEMCITGGIHSSAPVDQEPEVTMTRWKICEAKDKDGKVGLHAVGWSGREGRVSSAIGTIVAEEGAIRFTTASGRRYELLGSPGINMDAEYVWRHWKTINDIVEEKDVSHEYYTRQ